MCVNRAKILLSELVVVRMTRISFSCGNNVLMMRERWLWQVTESSRCCRSLRSDEQRYCSSFRISGGVGSGRIESSATNLLPITHNATMLSHVREDLSSALGFAGTCLASRFERERESWPRFRAARNVVWRNDRAQMSMSKSSGSEEMTRSSLSC